MDISELTFERYARLLHSAGSDLVVSLKARVRSSCDISIDSRGILAVDSQSGVRFRFIPGGSYQIGLSEAEELAARKIADPFPATIEEMRPVINVEVMPFFMSETPITNRLAQQTIGLDISGSEAFPALITKLNADDVANALVCRIPSEAEWEIGCRGGTATLFPFGDDLPPNDALGRWMEWNLSKPMNLPANQLGLTGLFFGEWCSDLFRFNYAPGAEVEQGSYVVRGGGAFFWPWQDEEWVWCMSAVRMPSSALPGDGRCAARLVFDLDI